MLGGIPVGQLSAGGLLAFVIVLVLTDRLVWYRRLRVVEAQLETVRALNVELAKQNKIMLESALPTVNAVLTALRQAAEEDGP